MILRKPYAFLIKHFKLIHLILLLPLVYLLFRTTRIVSFFNSYANSGSFSYVNNLAGNYVNVLSYIAIILILLVVFAITYLLVIKKKPIKLYIGISIYYILLLILLTITHGVLSDLEINIMKATTIRAYRDVAIIAYIPQYFFLIYTIIRGLGFDIRSFNFSSDLKGLEIDESDNEEFEVSISTDNYREKRKIKRSIREFKYYLIENRFVITCIGLTLVIIIGIVGYYNYFVYNKRYNESQIISNNGFQLTVNKSMITNLDYHGRIINKDKYYLVISLRINNLSSIDTAIAKKDFRLEIDDQKYYPIYDRSDLFIDFGVPYKGEKIESQSDENYVIVYEIPESAIDKKASIVIVNEMKVKDGQLNARYKYIKIKPTVVLNVNKITETLPGNEINIKDDLLVGATLRVDSVEMSDEYVYKVNGVTKRVLVDTAKYGFNNTLVIIKDNFNCSSDTYYSKLMTKQLLYTNHASIYYEKMGNKKFTDKVINITPNDLKDVTVLQVNKRILDGNTIKLELTLRDKAYYVKLK